MAGRPAFKLQGIGPEIKDDPEELPELLTLTEAAEMLNCTAKHLRDYIHTGDLPHYAIGRGYRVAKVDLIRWARSRRVASHA